MNEELPTNGPPCPQCGTLTIIDIDVSASNEKDSLVRRICQNCNFEHPVMYDSEKGWLDWE